MQVSRTHCDRARADGHAGDRVTDPKDNTVLVVIGDDTQRQLVGWIVAERNLPAGLVPNWRASLVSTIGAPSCIIADLDVAG
jgi:hypothetical protein